MESGGYSNDQLLKWTHEAALIDGFVTREGRYEIWRAGFRHNLSEVAARRLLIRLLTEQDGELERDNPGAR